MARPKKADEEKRERLSVTLSPGIKDRLNRLHAETGLEPSTLVDKALQRVLPIYERDPGEILRRPEE